MNEEKLVLILESEITGAVEMKEETKKLEICAGSPYRLLGVKGLESGKAMLDFAERAAMDGADYRGCHMMRREISIEFEVDAAMMSEELRSALIAFFVPGDQGMLTVDRGMGERQIGYYMQGAEFEQETLYAPLRVNVKLICSEPWFESKEESVLLLHETEPLLTFPFCSLSGIGITAGHRTKTTFLFMDNDGDLPTGVHAVFHVMQGTVVEPYLYCNGKRVTVNATLQYGDTLEISTCAGEKYVRINGEDAPFLRESEFFTLAKGENMLRTGAKSGSSAIGGEIRCRRKYLGA